MKKFMHFCVAVLIGAAALSFAACGGDDNNKDPNGNGGSSVPDPEGTIMIQMRNRDNGHTEIFMKGGGWFYISTANNFLGNVEFVSVGKVKGLGNIKNIPETGWSDEVAIFPGYGYIVRNGISFIRIYVIDYIKSTGGGIIGAIVKYQSPFIPENLPKSE